MNFRLIESISESLKVFRDDLYPFLGGGNKGRKMDAIGKDILQKRADALVTTGGFQSNHCRAVAVFAAQHKMKCTLVLHGSQEAFEAQSGNAKIMRLSGAQIEFVKEVNQISSTMDHAMIAYQRQGSVPYYIWGGGHTMEGGLAYINAVAELTHYSSTYSWRPDFIFHASGTGSTQAGILAGLDKFGFGQTQVIGISVAREAEQLSGIVTNFYKDLCDYYNIECSNREVIVLDNYLFGGYGKFNTEIEGLATHSIRQYGFTLDTCYTAKAFYGMQDFIHRKDLKGNILFWHTGGVFNFLAS